MTTGRNVSMEETGDGRTKLAFRPRTHGNVFLRFCIVYCSQGNREQPAHYLKQYKNARKRFRVYVALDTVSFSLAFYIVLRPQGIRKQMKTLRKRHRVYIALEASRRS